MYLQGMPRPGFLVLAQRAQLFLGGGLAQAAGAP